MPHLQIGTLQPGVAQVLLSRPEVFNAFDEALIAELDAAFVQLGQTPEVRCIVLAGEGKHFCAGADVQWMQRASSAGAEWNLADARRFATLLARIDGCPKPTVARVQGAALGGGAGLVAACDIAIASEAASFAISETRFGILPAVIGPYITNALGRRQARRLALSGERFGAAQALQMGLVHHVVPAQALDDKVAATLQELLLGGPQAQAQTKALLAQLHQGPVTAEVRELTAQTIARVRGGAEAREGFTAFRENRAPHWVPSAAGAPDTSA